MTDKAPPAQTQWAHQFWTVRIYQQQGISLHVLEDAGHIVTDEQVASIAKAVAEGNTWIDEHSPFQVHQVLITQASDDQYWSLGDKHIITLDVDQLQGQIYHEIGHGIFEFLRKSKDAPKDAALFFASAFARMENTAPVEVRFKDRSGNSRTLMIAAGLAWADTAFWKGSDQGSSAPQRDPDEYFACVRAAWVRDPAAVKRAIAKAGKADPTVPALAGQVLEALQSLEAKRFKAKLMTSRTDAEAALKKAKLDPASYDDHAVGGGVQAFVAKPAAFPNAQRTAVTPPGTRPASKPPATTTGKKSGLDPELEALLDGPDSPEAQRIRRIFATVIAHDSQLKNYPLSADDVTKANRQRLVANAVNGSRKSKFTLDFGAPGAREASIKDIPFTDGSEGIEHRAAIPLPPANGDEDKAAQAFYRHLVSGLILLQEPSDWPWARTYAQPFNYWSAQSRVQNLKPLTDQIGRKVGDVRLETLLREGFAIKRAAGVFLHPVSNEQVATEVAPDEAPALIHLLGQLFDKMDSATGAPATHQAPTEAPQGPMPNVLPSQSPSNPIKTTPPIGPAPLPPLIPRPPPPAAPQSPVNQLLDIPSRPPALNYATPKVMGAPTWGPAVPTLPGGLNTNPLPPISGSTDPLTDDTQRGPPVFDPDPPPLPTAPDTFTPGGRVWGDGPDFGTTPSPAPIPVRPDTPSVISDPWPNISSTFIPSPAPEPYTSPFTQPLDTFQPAPAPPTYPEDPL